MSVLGSPGRSRRVTVDAETYAVARAVRRELGERLATAAGDGTNGRRAGQIGRGGEATARAAVHELIEMVAAGRLARGERSLDAEAERVAADIAVAMVFGIGVLQVYVDDPAVENIDVNGADTCFVTYAGGDKRAVGQVADDDEELVAMVRAAAARFGLSERRFDAAQPELDLRLPDGSRLSAVMGVTRRPVVDIRRHRLADQSLDGLVALGALDDELAAMLAAAVLAKRNIVISGAMNSGKTTMLRALASAIPPEERIVTIEQALELGLDEQPTRHPDCVAMEARLANTEGVGAIGMAQLVRRSLRMNASRVIVGEVLGDEVVPMLNAMSQGRSGSMGTIHSDSSAGVFRRLASYAIQAPERLPLEATNLLIAGAIHLVVHLDSTVGPTGPDGTGGETARFVASVREVVDAEGSLLVSNEVWRPGSDGRAVRAAPLRDSTAALLAATGYDARDFRGKAAW